MSTNNNKWSSNHKIVYFEKNKVAFNVNKKVDPSGEKIHRLLTKLPLQPSFAYYEDRESKTQEGNTSCMIAWKQYFDADSSACIVNLFKDVELITDDEHASLLKKISDYFGKPQEVALVQDPRIEDGSTSSLTEDSKPPEAERAVLHETPLSDALAVTLFSKSIETENFFKLKIAAKNVIQNMEQLQRAEQDNDEIIEEVAEPLQQVCRQILEDVYLVNKEKAMDTIEKVTPQLQKYCAEGNGLLGECLAALTTLVSLLYDVLKTMVPNPVATTEPFKERYRSIKPDLQNVEELKKCLDSAPLDFALTELQELQLTPYK